MSILRRPFILRKIMRLQELVNDLREAGYPSGSLDANLCVFLKEGKNSLQSVKVQTNVNVE